MKLQSKFIILILMFLLYGFVYESEITFAECSWNQCDSGTCCDFYDCGGWDCDKEGNCWWTTITCSSCYECGSCYTVYDNGAACSTGSGPGVCSGGGCVPTCTYVADPCNCNTCGCDATINVCTGKCTGERPLSNTDGTNCQVGTSKGECITGACRDCDESATVSGSYCPGGSDYALYAPADFDGLCPGTHYAPNPFSVCCGDDPGETYMPAENKCCGGASGGFYTTMLTRDPIALPSDGTSACCPLNKSCVYGGTCYINGYKLCVGNYVTFCNSGTIDWSSCQFGCENGFCKQAPQATDVRVIPNPVESGITASFKWTLPLNYGT